MQRSIEFKNINESYYPSSIGYDDEELVESLNIIKRDLKGLISYIEDSKKGVFKSRLIDYLNEVRDALLVDIRSVFDGEDYGFFYDLDLLQIKSINDYIMFSVYISENYCPIIVIMSRKLKNMEFYFLEKREEVDSYIDAYFLTYFELEKNNVHMRGSYIKDYGFINHGNLESCTLELKKYQR